MTLVGDGIHNDGPALQAMLDEGGRVHPPKPAKAYRSSQALVLRVEGTRLTGEDTPATESIIFDADAGGLDIQANFCRVEDLTVRTRRGTVGSGVRITGRDAYLRHVTAHGFPEHGFHIAGWAKRDGTNANLWTLEYCAAKWNGGHGLFVEGADANAGTCIRFNAESNGRYGVCGRNLLSDCYVSGHIASNGNPGRGYNDATAAMCHFEGKRYAAHPDAIPSQLNDIIPPLSGAWVFFENGGPNGNCPDWTMDGDFAPGGPFAIGLDINARAGWWTPYVESNQAPAWIGDRTIVVGGNVATAVIGGGLGLNGEHIYNGTLAWRYRRQDGQLVGMQLLPNIEEGILMRAFGPGTDRRGVEAHLKEAGIEVHRNGKPVWTPGKP